MRNGRNPAPVTTSSPSSHPPPGSDLFPRRLRSTTARLGTQPTTEVAVEDGPMAGWSAGMSLTERYLGGSSSGSGSGTLTSFGSTAASSDISLSSSAATTGRHVDIGSTNSSRSSSSSSSNTSNGTAHLDRIIYDSDSGENTLRPWDAGLLLPSTVFMNSPPHSLTPRQPPEEIDLTVSSSESEHGDNDTVGAGGAYAVGGMGGFSFGNSSVGLDAFNGGFRGSSNDDVEILGSTTPSLLPPAPLRRKRRRNLATSVESGRGGASTGEVIVKRQCVMDVTSVESTSVSLHNNDVVERFKKELKCSICLDQLEDMTSTMCGHIFCSECIRTAIRATAKCPLCQRHLHLKDTHRLFF